MRKFHDLPINDISLRKFEKPSGNIKDIIRKFCISIGVLQPGDSRDIIVDLLILFLKGAKEKKFFSINEIYKYIINLNKKGTSPSNIRRHLKRLKDLDIIEKTPQGYRLREWLTLKEILNDFINFKVKPTLDRIHEYAIFIDNYINH